MWREYQTGERYAVIALSLAAGAVAAVDSIVGGAPM
jgi:hypothetical protein